MQHHQLPSNKSTMAKKMALPAVAKELLSALLHAGTTTTTPRPPPPPAARGSPAVHRCAPPAARLAGAGTTLVVDVDGALLLPRRSSLYFAYFMLVALEAGGFLRGLALLLLCPAISCIGALAGGDVAVRAMAAVAFCGLRVRTFRAGRAVLPRWLLEDVAAEALEATRRVGDPARVVWASAMPRVMVEPLLREYLLVPPDAAVAAREMKTVWGFYTGLMVEPDCDGEYCEMTSVLGKKTATGGDNDVVGFSAGDNMEFLCSPLASICKELYVVSPEEQSKWRRLPQRDYPKPLVFHDGRLAFLPTPLSAVAMFTWLPLGAVLAVVRLAIAMTLPYRYATALLAATGQSWRLRGALPPDSRGATGQLYACNHRTLIDPVYVSIALDRQVRAVSYSLSRVSDALSPIGRTVHLARDRARDGAAMARLLGRGDSVVVCPEGTTCREPYLLRFSPLFAELGGDCGGVVPVAIAVETSMFYATTASGWKGVDPFYYLSNPRMCYTVEFLDRVDTSPVREGKEASTDVANRVQRLIAEALGYECTMLTRKDKYLMLVGNDGVVEAPRRRKVPVRALTSCT
ncbi:putative glycerol-3-phosphate acyltransferase 3 [Dichanthelium oligosanthes]|uniref:Putative glycerol-3-phosphate acyltransferase 3 n=1 Tax=Dichanthelium oligosanthes TaxID=888268 RepID=A0A1E5W6T9_9POAL|nr:putative glycerol-3-phosphate acyltransferase 3 [Dichanthelium oligosanthes]